MLLCCQHAEVHECREGLHLCEHICSNTNGSYVCSCYDGYYPASNGFSCIGIIIVKLVLSDRVWALKKWPLNTGGLCIEVKISSKGAFGTQPSGL